MKYIFGLLFLSQLVFAQEKQATHVTGFNLENAFWAGDGYEIMIPTYTNNKINIFYCSKEKGFLDNFSSLNARKCPVENIHRQFQMDVKEFIGALGINSDMQKSKELQNQITRFNKYCTSEKVARDSESINEAVKQDSFKCSEFDVKAAKKMLAKLIHNIEQGTKLVEAIKNDHFSEAIDKSSDLKTYIQENALLLNPNLYYRNKCFQSKKTRDPKYYDKIEVGNCKCYKVDYFVRTRKFEADEYKDVLFVEDFQGEIIHKKDLHKSSFSYTHQCFNYLKEKDTAKDSKSSIDNSERDSHKTVEEGATPSEQESLEPSQINREE